MIVSCKICDRSFEKFLTNTHLKRHGYTLEMYRDEYGEDSVSCQEYRARRSEELSGSNNPMFGKTQSDDTRAKISKKNTGKTPHNKGQKLEDETVLAKLRDGIKRREDNYRLTGRPKLPPMSDETKSKISRSNTGKSVSSETRRKLSVIHKGNTYRRGKKLSDEAKRKISVKSTEAAQKKSAAAFQVHLARMNSIGLNHIETIGRKTYLVSCRHCGKIFTRTSMCFTSSRFRQKDCTFCDPFDYKRSKAENEIYEYVSQFVECHQGDRTIIAPLELDIAVPEMKIAIEYCGLYWHSGESYGQDYHRAKMMKCNAAGYRLITIFEDEWLHHRSIVEDQLKAILGPSAMKRIHAEDCEVVVIDQKSASRFLIDNHLQGSCRSSIRVGLMHSDELVALCTFYENKKGWELNRLCFKVGTSVIDGVSRMMSSFVKDHPSVNVTSYCDLRWSDGKVNEEAGFERIMEEEPDCWYVDGTKRVRRHSRMKSMRKIWDCGHAKYVNRINIAWDPSEKP